MQKLDEIEQLWYLLNNTRHLVSKARRDELVAYNITGSQAAVLSCIYELGDRASIRGIAKRMLRESHSISEQLKRMEKNGLINIDKGINRKNKGKYSLTDEGLEAFQYAKKTESLHEIMSVLSDEEREILKVCLEKILTKAQEF